MTAERRARLAPLAVVAAAALLLAACGSLLRVDAPFTLLPDHRLELIGPTDDERTVFPVTVEWEVEDFAVGVDGNHFGVFANRQPIAPRARLRLPICFEAEKRPPAQGELRRACRDDRDRVFHTFDTSITIACLEVHQDRPARTRDRHEVHVILLDGDNRRVGETSVTASFIIDEERPLGTGCPRILAEESPG